MVFMHSCDSIPVSHTQSIDVYEGQAKVRFVAYQIVAHACLNNEYSSSCSWLLFDVFLNIYMQH